MKAVENGLGWLKPLHWGLAAIAAAWIGLGCCGTDLAETVPIPDSEWVVLTEVYGCSALDRGSMKIVAENQKTHERIDLVTFPGGAYESSVAVAGPEEIVVTLPNLVEFERKAERFGKYEVSISFAPKDDPEERRNYQLWLHHPSDPHAQQWHQRLMARSVELEIYYRKCMEIQRGQTKEKVRAVMADFQIACQEPRELVFNTRTFSAHPCVVRFSDEATSHVTSVVFSSAVRRGCALQ